MPSLARHDGCSRKAQAGRRFEFVGVSASPANRWLLRLRSPPTARPARRRQVPKIVHDWKTALHRLAALGCHSARPITDTMLLSYALNPTHATQTLVDVVARSGQSVPPRSPAQPTLSRRSAQFCAKRRRAANSPPSTRPSTSHSSRPLRMERPASASISAHSTSSRSASAQRCSASAKASSSTPAAASTSTRPSSSAKSSSTTWACPSP
jgi:hypothetical protein